MDNNRTEQCIHVHTFRFCVLLIILTCKLLETFALLQISDGCEGYTLGDTEFSFQLTVEVFNENTTGFYSASVTNPGGTAEVDRTFVTGEGELYTVYI